MLLGRINQMKSTWANNSVKWELGTWIWLVGGREEWEGRILYSGDSGVPSFGFVQSAVRNNHLHEHSHKCHVAAIIKITRNSKLRRRSPGLTATSVCSARWQS